MSTQDSEVASILEGLRSSRSREVWAEFLRQYSPIILQTCQYATSDADEKADCFLFACEQLSRKNFRRLLRFRPEGPASLSTWLSVVVRNLCLDWHRKRLGRPRLFRSITKLPQLSGAVYRCRFEQGFSSDETLMSLRPNFPGLTMEQLAAAEEQVRESLSSRQLWLSSGHKARLLKQSEESSIGVDEAMIGEPADTRPSQEESFAAREQEHQLRLALGNLSQPQRLLIRLRFEQSLTLEEIAVLTDLGDAQRVHRRITAILEKLRKKIS
jgi:RNA polymerase sigma factor (sigma-70 family)